MEGSTNLKCKARFISNKGHIQFKTKDIFYKKSTMLHTFSWVVAESIIKSTSNLGLLFSSNPEGN